MSKPVGTVVRRIDERCYSGYGPNWDDRLFRERILGKLRPNSVVLDLGAGAGIVEWMNFRGHAGRMCGVDLDERVITNPLLDEGRVADAGRIPYEDGVFDVVFSDNVLEHLQEPLDVFLEVTRVLKPGGVFLFKTPNKWHYVPMLARLTPHRFHQYINRLRGREEEDTFPTVYRANTGHQIARFAERAGLIVESIDRIEGRPEYLRMHWLLYLLGLAYERTVNATSLLAPFRVLLIGVLRKQTKGQPS